MVARVLFMGLIVHADDAGRMPYSARRIKMQIFPADSLDVMLAIAELTELKLIRLYEVEGRSYLCIPNFLRHQRVHNATPSKIPQPDPETLPAIPEISVALPKTPERYRNLTAELELERELELEGKGKGTGTEETPPDLHPLNYAAKICDELSLPHKGNLEPFAGAIEALIKSGKSKISAFEYLLARALDAQQSGELKSATFWCRDGKYNERRKETADEWAAGFEQRRAARMGQ